MKCDSAPNTCQRCARDGYKCPGYEKKTAWKVVTPSAMKKSTSRRRAPTSARHGSSEPSSTITTDVSALPSPYTKDLSGDLTMPASLILSTVEKEILEIQSAIIYYNETLVPDLAASPIPNETISIPMDIWLQKSPRVLQHIIVTIVACHRIASNGSRHGMPNAKEESQLADTLNRHRGRGVMQLRRTLSGPRRGDGEPALSEDQRRTESLATLASVLMFLTQEVQMSATSLWSMHLEAARSLVLQLGGVETLWSRAPMYQGLFTLYTMIDIMSPPTSPAWSINEAQQREYLDMIGRLEAVEQRFIASFQPCPLPVLTGVIRTNILRAALHSQQTTRGSIVDTKSTEETLFLTLASLLRFDPADWSRKVCTDYLCLPLPQRKDDCHEAAWTALATCYQTAAIIYLLRSMKHTPIARSVGQDTEGLLPEQRSKLFTALSFLCRDLSCVKASGLWRFVSWSLFIYAYELVGWMQIWPSITNISPESGYEHDEAIVAVSVPPNPPNIVVMALRRLQKVGRRLGANCLFDGVELLQGVWRRRWQNQAFGGGGGMWNWDDGFAGRCVFVV